MDAEEKPPIPQMEKSKIPVRLSPMRPRSSPGRPPISPMKARKIKVKPIPGKDRKSLSIVLLHSKHKYKFHN